MVPRAPSLLPSFPQHHIPFHSVLLPTYISFELLCSQLPQTVQLKTAHIYDLTVSMGQEVEDSLSGSFVQGLIKLPSWCQLGCSHPEAWLGKNPLPSSLRLLAEFFSLWPPD